MRILAAIAAIGVVATSANAAPQSRPVRQWTAAIHLSGKDAISVRFRKAVEARIRTDSDLTLASDFKSADLRIESSTPSVDWDTLGGRMVVIYILRAAGPRENVRISGVCYANDLDKCARELLRRSKHYVLRR